MKIGKDNKAIYESVVCWDCKGKGTVVRHKLCPRWNKKQHGKACEFCGAKNKDSHETVSRYTTLCPTCNGKKTIMEDLYSSMNNNFFRLIPIKVIRTEEEQTFNEAYLGYGMISSVTDYGRHEEYTNKELIEMIQKEHDTFSLVQYINIVKNNIVARKLCVVTNRDGYSIVASWEV